MKNSTCTFDIHSDKRKPVPRSYVAALEARIKTLEDVIRARGGGAALGEAGADPALESIGQSGLVGDRGHDRAPRVRDSCVGVGVGVGVDESSSRLPEDSGASVEAILDIGRIRLSVSRAEDELGLGLDCVEGGATGFCYYGPTASRFLSREGASEPLVINRYEVRDSILHRSPTNLFDDPVEAELLDKFWTWQEIHCTVVDKLLFLESYNKGERDSEWVSGMLVDMMLAIGVLFGHQGHARAALYSARAEALVISELARPTMATMQAVQLMSIFEMGAGRVSVGWSLNGLAVAMSNKLGLHIDSTELVVRGVMSQRMKDMRDMAFWGIFVLDRLFSIIMGVHPLHNRRSISTRRIPGCIRPNILPGNVKLAGGEPVKVINHHALSPIEGSWVRFSDLCDIVETMLMDIYAFDAPVRSAMEDHDLVTNNNLVIQAFIEDLPTNVTAENITRATVTNLRPVSLHIFINLFIIMINRPFIGARQLSSTQSRMTSAANQAVEKRSRALAFGHCRAAALRIIALVKHFIHSPCFTSAFDIFSACTILLLCPQDPDAMKAVRTGLGYLDQLKRSHYWVESAEDSRQRILGLAQKWNVQIFSDDSPDDPQPQLTMSASTSNVEDTGLPAPDAGAWDNLNAPIDWTALSFPEIASDPFTGPDAALFAAYPSAELGEMYGDLGIPMDVTQELDSWWFMGSQPSAQFEKSGARTGQF
ncbi:Nitrogen assimilation transcription factor nira protein [Ceratobasidium theobromae]|uniref:Nitrogen assimilation transcription factor nira protein n=1 Tax=Ceratobasidium theobromae TaxID=1582974 RepID=A0A5N5QKK7_9AGAM|nr:Nitrogen assimilation transcription factor nira protein [Ceratobasidium theobromae]